MIVSRSALRISFFGGSSDVPAYFNKGNPGLVISTTIDKFMYLVVNKTSNSTTKVSYSKVEEVDDINRLEHNLVRETIKQFYIENGLEIASFSEIPTVGTGLGSSSCYVVGLITALNALYNIPATKFDVAEQACYTEIDLCGSPIGKQDQYASTFGGLNMYKFETGGVTVSPVNISRDTYDDLQSRLCLFYTNTRRNANDILKVQNTNVQFKQVDKLVQQAELAEQYLINGDIDSFGDLLDEAWQIKRSLAPGITNDGIDEIYQAARNAGALGGKILGAGGGGYFLAYVPDHHFEDVCNAMARFGLSFFEFNFWDKGSEVVYNSRTKAF